MSKRCSNLTKDCYNVVRVDNESVELAEHCMYNLFSEDGVKNFEENRLQYVGFNPNLHPSNKTVITDNSEYKFKVLKKKASKPTYNVVQPQLEQEEINEEESNELEVAKIEFPDGVKRTQLRPEMFEFIEDDREDQAFIFYANEEGSCKNFAFGIMNNGQLVQNSFVPIKDHLQLYYNTDFSLCKSSNLMLGERGLDFEQKKVQNYFSQHYQCMIFEHG